MHREQLAALGIGRGAVAHRVAAGRLHLVLPAVFAVGHVSLSPRAWLLAALLYGGEDCVLSHGSAVAAWGLIEAPPTVPVITVAGRHVRLRGDVSVHRVSALAAADVRIRAGLPVTAPPLALLDFASVSGDDALADAVAAARRARLVSDRELDDVLDRHPRRTGAARLRRALASEPAAAITRSEAERRFRRLVTDAELPAPQDNVRVAGLEVDFLWRPERLVVEVDGYRFHDGRPRWERDRHRDQRLLAAGFRVLRVSWRQLVQTPVAVAVRIGQALAAARTA